VAATLACVATIGVALGLDPRAALVMGGLVAMSSTALAMRLLSQRGEIDTPHGQLSVGILLFQDLCVVPFLLAVPILAARGADASNVVLELVQALAALAVFFVIARFLLPGLLDRAARLRSREVFTMVAILSVVGSAVIAERIGLTLSVGAFVGGLVLAATPYAHQLFAEVVPLRGLLLGVFFTAVGMLFDPRVAAEHWLGITAYAAGVVALKAGFVAAIVALALRQGVRLGVLTGLTLAQTGEFSFVLAAAAAQASILDAGLHQIFIAGSIVTLLATPLLVRAAPSIASFLDRRAERSPTPEPEAGLPQDHVVLIGFGLAGKNLARALRARGIPYSAIDANAISVRTALARGEPILYGDATRVSLLERAGIRRARLITVAVSDPIATREIVARARNVAPEIPILARTRWVREVDSLENAGATKVIAEEFESTLELMGAALQHFGVPEESIARFAAELRSEGYEFLRDPDTILDPWLVELLEEVASHWVSVPASFEGEGSLSELGVRAQTGANIVAVARAGSTTPNPDPSFRVHAGDRLLALGTPDAIERLEALLRRSNQPFS
jgi:CPA2 family monovalent cation:H+ antiporter-2